MSLEQIEKDIVEWVRSTLGENVNLTFEAPKKQMCSDEKKVVSAYLISLQPLPSTPGETTDDLCVCFNIQYLITVCGSDVQTEKNRLLTELAFTAQTHPNLSLDVRGFPMELWTTFNMPPKPGFLLNTTIHRSVAARSAKRVKKSKVEIARTIRLYGKIVGPEKIPIPWALVELTNLHRKTRTDVDGLFSIDGINTGKPTILRVTAKGQSYNARMENVGSREKPEEIPIHFKEN